MKKLMVLVIVAALMTLVFPAVVGATQWSPENPGIYPKLIAGKQTEVGNVHIWNDAEYLYIDYHIWYPYETCLLEAHAHVATSLALIPQTKTGNPIPGKFMFKNDTLGCVSFVQFKYQLPAGWTPGTTLIVAAHAVVQKTADPGWQETAWTLICGEFWNYSFPGKNWGTWVPYVLEQP